MSKKDTYPNGLNKAEWEEVTDAWGTYYRQKKSSKGKKSYSDYWTGKYYNSFYSSYGLSQGAKKEWKLKKCLHDVSKIATIFEDKISLGYLTPENSKNNVNTKEVFIDPRIALDDNKNLGEKIDYYAGDVLVNSAYRSLYSKKDRILYLNQYRNLHQDSEDPDFSVEDKIIANIFMSIESNRAHQLIQDKTPGFKPYCKVRASEKVKDIDSEIKELLNGDEDSVKMGELCSLIREIDTNGMIPLEEYSFELKNIIKESLDDAFKCKSTKDSLALAKEIYQRYKFGDLNNLEKVNLPNQSDIVDGNPYNSKNNPLDSLEKSLTTKDLHGSIADPQNNDLEKFLDKLSKELGQHGTDYDESFKPEKLKKWTEGQFFKGMVKNMSPSIYSFDEYYSKRKHLVGRLDYLRFKNNEVLDEGGEFSIDEKHLQMQLYNKIKNKNFNLIEAMKDAISFSNSDNLTWEENGRRSGFLDEGGLEKAAYRSDTLFYNPIIESRPKVLVSIVIDQSYSMGEFGMLAAKEIAISMAEAIKDVPGVDLLIYIQSGGEECNIGRYITLDTPYDEYHKLAFMPGACHTYDGYVIKAVGEEMSGIDGYDRRLIFMISDGEPAGPGYEGVEAIKHTNSVSEFLRSNMGVEVYGLGVNGAYTTGDGLKEALVSSGIDGNSKGEFLYGRGNALCFEDFDANKISAAISTFLGHICNKE